MRHNSLLRIDWLLEPTSKVLKHNQMELEIEDAYFKQELHHLVEITFEGLDEFMEDYIREIGGDILDELAIPFIKNQISKELKPVEFSGNNLMACINDKMRNKRGFGEFILVYEVNSYGPDREGEYDLEVDCVGVLGENVKLVY